ncbi:MAG TPA: NAD(P)/FAD-dependent oxidoreductase [Polyangiales bacterium]|nr:NAD(P)/FAD-dependent oxidoreductase [Polyangiales bacterium]
MSNHTQIAIVGSGFAGMGAAIKLRDHGFNDFAIFERADDVGGTWRDNTYPGCACDVESVLYSYSFEQNPGWSRSFSPQPEIRRYLQRVYEDAELQPKMRFGHELLGARWDEASKRWRLETSKGLYTADVLVSGMGGLCEPAYPNLPGLDKFEGKTFHSARWDHDYVLEGKRVGVIGTGASAIQFVPQIQPRVKKLTLFQRTPAWIIPRHDRAISDTEHKLFARFPALLDVMRSLVYVRRELFVLGFKVPTIMRLVEQVSKLHLKKAIKDPELRKKLTPSFRLGCKRILISNDYYPSLTQPNVHVETHGIKEVRAHSIVTEDGVEHEVDALVFGTGFKVADMPLGNIIHARDGRTLAEHWQGTPEAHLGTTVKGVPNFFSILGPNTGLGHTSMVLQIESQVALVIETLEHMRDKRIRTVEPRPEAQAAFVASIAELTAGTVWTGGGCKSWYLDDNGKNSVLWPTFTFTFRRQAHFRPEEYIFDAVHKSEPVLQGYGTPVTA